MNSMRLLFFVLFVTTSIFSQSNDNKDDFRNRGYFNISRIGLISINKAELETFSPQNGVVNTDISTNNTNAFSLQTINGYFFSPYFSAG
ncbi:hypothetical protein [Winogradskyella sp.]|uniref:hypothetical protein n=1 Tax=Winogradskyella sp. TaxID=1883156 RepID=UPI003F6B7A64